MVWIEIKKVLQARMANKPVVLPDTFSDEEQWSEWIVQLNMPPWSTSGTIKKKSIC